MQLTTLKAQSRKLSDSRANVRLRKQGLIPAVCYGLGQEPLHIIVDAVELREVLAPGKRYTLIDLTIDGKGGNAVIIHDYQKDSLTQKITHIDFLRINAESEVKVRTPVRLEGVPVGVKTQGGLLSQEKRYLNLICKPTEIPTELVINIDECNAGITFYASQIQLGSAKLASKPKTCVFTISKGRREEKVEAAAPAKGKKK